MSYSIDNLEKDIKEILSICKEDLFAISIGQERQATREQIEETIMPEMNKLLEQINKNEVPEKNQRWILSTAYITRGWNWDIRNCSILAKKLALLDDKYRYELED